MIKKRNEFFKFILMTIIDLRLDHDDITIRNSQYQWDSIKINRKRDHRVCFTL